MTVDLEDRTDANPLTPRWGWGHCDPSEHDSLLFSSQASQMMWLSEGQQVVQPCLALFTSYQRQDTPMGPPKPTGPFRLFAEPIDLIDGPTDCQSGYQTLLTPIRVLSKAKYQMGLHNQRVPFVSSHTH